VHKIRAEAGGVNMYTHLLSSVLDDWVDAFTGEALVNYALVCRAEMLASPSRHWDAPEDWSACGALGVEIAYDRALIKLCAANGIEVSVEGFSHPAPERARLEHQLAISGIDLMDLARRRDS
jgi:hypothetical protein